MDSLFGLFFSIYTSFQGVKSALPKPTPIPTPAPKNYIIRSGEYSYAGQTLKYTIHLPKNGGKLTGSFSGACNGPIEGTFDGGPAQVAEGEAEARCIFLLNKKLEAKYVAHFDLEGGKAYVDWKGDIPYTSGQGSFTAEFEPVN